MIDKASLCHDSSDMLAKIGVAELTGREVDCHMQINVAHVDPRAHLPACHAQHQVSYGNDKPCLLSEPDELPGRDKTALLVPPADQSFKRCDAARREINARLVMQLEVLLCQGVAQVGLQT